MTRTCSVKGCCNKHYGKGLCSMHYQRIKKTGKIGTVDSVRFISNGYCSVEGCSRPHYAKSMCNTHYMRMWVYGTTDLAGTTYGEPLAWLFDVALKHKDKKKCLIWPYARNNGGYGQVRYKGKSRLVHRIVCRKVHGRPTRGKRYALHSCGNGHLGCINPIHTYWGTQTDNMLDRVKHGTGNEGVRNGQAKLTDEKVRKVIRLIHKNWSDARIANKFSVSPSTIWSIRLGKSWLHIERCEHA